MENCSFKITVNTAGLFLPEQDECRDAEVGKMRSRAGSDQVPSLELHKFVISGSFFGKAF